MNKFMLKLIFVCTALCSLSLQADVEMNAQEAIVDRLLTVRNVCTSELSDICSADVYRAELSNDAGLSQFASNTDEDIDAQVAKKSSKSSDKFETYAVAITFDSGYTFHIADYYGYYGHSRVVTCLDGPMRGRQGIADNGILMVESTAVKWHKKYFVHTYPAAKIYTYSDKQVFELK